MKEIEKGAGFHVSFRRSGSLRTWLNSGGEVRIMYYASGKFSRSLKPFGSNVLSCLIQKSSLLRRVSLVCSFVMFFWDISSNTIIQKSRSN